METIQKYYRVDRKEICFLRSIVEAYDGIAMMRTVDPGKGVVVFHVAPNCEADVDALLSHIRNDVMIEARHVEK